MNFFFHNQRYNNDVSGSLRSNKTHIFYPPGRDLLQKSKLGIFALKG